MIIDQATTSTGLSSPREAEIPDISTDSSMNPLVNSLPHSVSSANSATTSDSSMDSPSTSGSSMESIDVVIKEVVDEIVNKISNPDSEASTSTDSSAEDSETPKVNRLQLNGNCLDDLRFYTNAPGRSYIDYNEECQLSERMLRLMVSKKIFCDGVL